MHGCKKTKNKIKEKHYTWLQNNKNKNNIHGCKIIKIKTIYMVAKKVKVKHYKIIKIK
jgi:hypothetical protein